MMPWILAQVVSDTSFADCFSFFFKPIAIDMTIVLISSSKLLTAVLCVKRCPHLFCGWCILYPLHTDVLQAVWDVKCFKDPQKKAADKYCWLLLFIGRPQLKVSDGSGQVIYIWTVKHWCTKGYRPLENLGHSCIVLQFLHLWEQEYWNLLISVKHFYIWLRKVLYVMSCVNCCNAF